MTDGPTGEDGYIQCPDCLGPLKAVLELPGGARVDATEVPFSESVNGVSLAYEECRDCGRRVDA